MNKKVEEALANVQEQLTGFQKASVAYVLDQFLNRNRNKVLIADEVGLGKTIIAKALIAHLMTMHVNPRRPFHVVYICSNQVLASQNIKKLNPIGENSQPISRLTYLAIDREEKDDALLRISSLTPSTSMQTTKSIGIVTERAILYELLTRYVHFSNHSKGMDSLLQGQVGRQTWKDEKKWCSNNGWRPIKPLLHTKFKKQLEALDYNPSAFPRMHAFLGNWTYSSFFTALQSLIKKLAESKPPDLDFQYEVVRTLRMELSKACLYDLNADLFILDEFQRFKTLIDKDNDSEAGELAQLVFGADEKRVLLLSATPFKPLTTSLEELHGENHHVELKRVVQFLGASNGDSLWSEFKKDQQAFFEILRRPKEAIKAPNTAISAKNNLENSFKKFLSRNERMNLVHGVEDLVHSQGLDRFSVIKDDVQNFIAIDRLMQELSEIGALGRSTLGSTLEFSKSAPYPLSYLQGYAVRTVIDEHRDSPTLQPYFERDTGVYLPYEKVENYSGIGYDGNESTYPNGKLRMLADECFKDNAELLLWVPPTKPIYKPFGVFEKGKDFSKILIFSSWKMVPRAVSTLISYEVERRTIGAEKAEDLKEQGPRTYWETPRRPGRIFEYKTPPQGRSVPPNLTLLTLGYPCRTLVRNSLFHFPELFTYGESFEELVTKQGDVIAVILNELGFQDLIKGSEEDSRWYWLAGPLMDELNPDLRDKAKSISRFNTEGKRIHIDYMSETVSQVIDGSVQLGKLPKDLFEVLARVTLAGPANAALWAIDTHFPELGSEYRKLNASYQIGDLFRSLFNGPESISAVRLSTNQDTYWRSVLEYCASGNIMSMLDEYFFMLKSATSFKDYDGLVSALDNVMSLHHSTVDVDLQKNSGEVETRTMRSHFAVSYGMSSFQTESGTKRETSVREVFNSPFRPFVLSSTSIGQEGLDFHFYCRKIFHWNLPHNAIDIEQREGRINRFRGLVIRKRLAETITYDQINADGIQGGMWDQIFALANDLCQNDASGITPNWHVADGTTRIERFVPIHQLSKDKEKYDQLLVTLALYRLTFGQPRQEELLEALKNEEITEEELNFLREELLINLSPMQTEHSVE
jgi:hypothetical protein